MPAKRAGESHCRLTPLTASAIGRSQNPRPSRQPLRRKTRGNPIWNHLRRPRRPWSRRSRSPCLTEILEELQRLSGTSLAGIDPRTNFIELGFDSLFLTQASLALQKRFRVPITFRRLLEDVPSPQELADWLQDNVPAHIARCRTGRSPTSQRAQMPRA